MTNPIKIAFFGSSINIRLRDEEFQGFSVYFCERFCMSVLLYAPGASVFNYSSPWLSILQRESWTMLGIQVPWILYHWMVTMATATAWPAPITWATACKSSTARTTYTKRPRWRNGSWKSSPPTTCPLTWTTTTARPNTDATLWTSWWTKSATEAGWKTRPCCPSILRWAWTTLHLSRPRTV